ncbi:MAG: TIGR01906 family membrane protein [Chloroflexi bacterium]|nr:TIGR01906 family membrane protein [Chloroflexota bacterium]
MFERKSENGLGLIPIFIIGAFIVLVPVALITTTIRVAVSEQSIYDYSVKRYDAHLVSGVPEEELLRANGEIHQYLTGEYAGPLSIAVQFKDGTAGPLFNARETAHMADVRDLVRGMFAVQIAAIAAVLALAVVMLVVWPPRALAAAGLYGSVLTGGVLAMGGFLVLTGFDAAWSQFHVIAFPNGLWQLNPNTDHLIQMFPEAFWERATVAVGGAIVFEAGIIASAAWLYLYLTRAQPESDLPLKPEPALPGAAGHARVSPSDTPH